MSESPAGVQWRMQGNYIKNCSCDPGCPCDFNAEPTHHHCEGMAGMEIASGNFGDVSLDGLKWAATYRWPGPLHEGHGTLQPFIDANASEEQRTALLTILSGQVGGTFFEILAAIVDTFLDPQFVQIDFTADVDARRARMNAHGGFETESLPIMNPVTKEEHRVLVQMPEGFEYRLAEIGSAASIESNSGIPLHITNGHSSLARVTFAP